MRSVVAAVASHVYDVGSRESQDSRVMTRCGVPAGCTSLAFSLAEFAEALMATPEDQPNTVYVARDAGGRLAACGGGRSGAARAAACARLAPHPPARSAVLCAAADGAALRLRLASARDLPPHAELLLWPDDELLALAGVPVLTPVHIRGGAEYRCDVCGARYDQPNPLKIHLYLECTPPTPHAFWRRLLARLAATTPPTPNPAPVPSSPASAPSPAALEALAAAWGAWGARGGAGHACLYCGKLYSRKYGLKIHIRTHTGYKPLRCAHCARRFGDPSNLNKHVRLHAASAPSTARHACTLCGAVLARRRDLDRHVRARHAPPAPAPKALPAG